MFYCHSSLPPTQQGSTERLFWVYLGTAIPGIPIVMILQGALLFPFVNLMFTSTAKDFLWHEFETVKKESDIRDDAHRAERAAFTATPSYWAFVFYMSFVVAAGTEDLLKYAIILIGRGKVRVIHQKEYIMYGAAAGLGFATLEKIFSGWMGSGVPLHMVAGMLTAVNLVQRDLKKERLGHLSVVGPSTFFHGLFDCALFGYSAWSGHIGWVHPEDVGGMVVVLVATVAVGVATTLTLRQRMAKLEIDGDVVARAKRDDD